MPAILDRMPAGTPGDVSRKADSVLEPVRLAEDIVYGSPVQLNAAGEAVTVFDDTKPIYGVLARPYPTQATAESDNAFGVGTAKAGSVRDVLRSGYMTVRISAAEGTAPAKGTAVTVVFTATGSYAKGEFAVTQGTAMAGTTYMGEPDASGNTEIAVNI